MFASVQSVGLLGIDGYMVRVETDLSQGLPGFDVVGLPGAAVRESRDRVRAVVKNTGFSYPVSRITVNLAPADVKKEGSVYDLPLYLALLLASHQLSVDLHEYAFIGELSLTGELQAVRGVLPMVIAARDHGVRRIVVPAANAAEGAVVDGIEVLAAAHVTELLRFFAGDPVLQPVVPQAVPAAPQEDPLDFCDVMGQPMARRAMEIAAAGMHNILLIGPPGSGKSMLAKRLPSILPDMTPQEALDATKIHSIAGTLPSGVGLLRHRPFRAPHHNISAPGLAGGGTVPRPGEVSLAHHGVLFLDELPEFSRQAMECLRQPLEDGHVTISRVSGSLRFPCDFMLVAAMNPCPCGYFGHPTRRCTCTSAAATAYLSRISGPLLDRIDLHVEVPPVAYDQLAGNRKEEGSAAIRARVNAARAVQRARYEGTGILGNAQIPAGRLRDYCPLTPGADAVLHAAFDKLGLSARTYDRLLKVARTIADLAGSDVIDVAHISEAVQYRSLDRKYWTAR